jgi:hypothetical protein
MTDNKNTPQKNGITFIPFIFVMTWFFGIRKPTPPMAFYMTPFQYYVLEPLPELILSLALYGSMKLVAYISP